MDCGDFGSSTSKAQVLKVQYLLKGMSELHYDAINLAERDLQYGREFLLELQEKYELPFVSANVYDKSTGRLFVQPHIIRDYKTVKVGIFGVTDAAMIDKQLGSESDFEVRDARAAARAEVQTLREECDVVVALAHLGVKNAIKLAEEVPGIDVVISGHYGSHLRKLQVFGSTAVMQSGSKGKYLGHITFSYADNKVTFVDGKTVALTDKISDDRHLAGVVSEYDDALLLAYPLETAKAQADYSLFSEKACSGCHLKEHNQWTTTLHSHAWQTLVREKQAHNPECQHCHTTMFGEENGFASLRDTPDMVNVQCSSCHVALEGEVDTHMKRFRGQLSSGNGHTDGQEVDFKQVTETTCLRCHTEDNSPNFDYQVFRAKIIHSNKHAGSGTHD